MASPILSLQEVAELTSLLADNKALVVIPASSGNVDQGTMQLGVVDLETYGNYFTGALSTRVTTLEQSAGSGIFPTPITLTLSGPVTGSVTFDGSSNQNWTSSIANGALSMAMVSGLVTELSGFDSDIAALQSASTTYLTLTGGNVTGPVTFSSNITMAADILPDTDNTRSLGSVTRQWKDVYIGPGSLYVNGQEVISNSAAQIIISADLDQDVVVQTKGNGQLELKSSSNLVLFSATNGNIQLMNTVMVQAGMKIQSSDGNSISFGDSIAFDSGRGITGGLLIDGNQAWHSGNFNPATKANLTGATFTGAGAFGNNGVQGYTTVNGSGSATVAGFVGFYTGDGVRHGYIGNSNAGRLQITPEQGDVVELGGSTNVIGTLTVAQNLLSNTTAVVIGPNTGVAGNIYLRPGGYTSTTNQLVLSTAGLTVGGNTIWHAGNFTPSAFVTAASPQLTTVTPVGYDIADTAAARANGVQISGVGNVGGGGAILFGSGSVNFAYIKGYFTNGSTNGTGKLVIGTRNSLTDTSMTNKIVISENGDVAITDGALTVAGTVTGTAAYLGVGVFTSSGVESQWATTLDDCYWFQNVNNTGYYSTSRGYIFQIAKASKAITTQGALTANGTFTVNCVSSTDVFAVNNPGSSPAGSVVQITSPGGIPGIIGNYGGSYRTDLKFNSGGLFSIAVSSSSSGSGDQFTFSSVGTFTATGNVTASGVVGGARVYAGWDSGSTNSISCSGWFRTTGQTGYYCSSYGSGIYMTDTTYVRAYNGAAMAASDFVITSDAREKAGIRPFEFKGRLTPKSFTMKKDGTRDFGFIAQDIMNDYPEAVGYIEEADRYQLSYGKLTAILSHQINTMEDEVAILKTKLEKAHADISSLQEPLLRKIWRRLVQFKFF